MLDLQALPVDHAPEELCLHRRALNRRRHLIDTERVGPVLIEFPGKAVDGHLVPFCLVSAGGNAMSKVVNRPVPQAEPVVLSIDIGGSNVKILTSAGGTIRKAKSGPDMTASQVVTAVSTLAEGWTFDVVSIGARDYQRLNFPSSARIAEPDLIRIGSA